MGHAVVHFEIGGPDDRHLAAFYAELFGWSMYPVPGVDYTLIDTLGGGGINGGIARTADGEASVTFYIETDDLQAILDKVNLVGGRTVTSITELAGMVTFAKLGDPDALEIGIVLGPAESTQAIAPGPSPGAGAPVDWFEVLGSDADRSQRFYGEVFGWQISRSEAGYLVVDTCSPRGISGGIGAASQQSWATVYASVDDVDAMLVRAVELGGSREYGPVKVSDQLRTGALRDPAGNVFGVYHRAPH
jgi:uncharacterized protein